MNNFGNELFFIYGLVFIVIILIIIVLVLDKKDEKRLRNKKNLSDTLTMKPISEDMIDKDLISDIDVKKNQKEVIKEENTIEPYVETDLEKTQAQLRVEEITKALKEALKEEQEDKFAKYELEQENNAIISLADLTDSYDELYEKVSSKQMYDDENIPINIEELYKYSEREENDEVNKVKLNDFLPKKEEVKEENVNTDSKFKNSPYISPVYGIEKDEEEEFLNNLKELRDNLN